jgi:hypothetical protein
LQNVAVKERFESTRSPVLLGEAQCLLGFQGVDQRGNVPMAFPWIYRSEGANLGLCAIRQFSGTASEKGKFGELALRIGYSPLFSRLWGENGKVMCK